MHQVSTRSKLVQAGFAIFYAKGFNGSSVQDITEAAGVPKGSFYSYFKSKELLALEILGMYERLGRLELLKVGPEAPLKRVFSHFKYLQQLHANDLCRGCFFGNFALELAGTHPLIREALQAGFDRWSQAIAATLREAIEAGELERETDTERLARHLVSSWEGAILQVKVNQTTRPFDEFYFFMNEVLRPAKPAAEAGKSVKLDG